MGAREDLHEMAQAISAAHNIVKLHMPTIETFLKECRDMENFGCLINPTLYISSERRAVEAFLKPICAAAREFSKAIDAQQERAQAALAKVKA